MSLHKVRINKVELHDFYHNPINTISIHVEGSVLDPDGREKLIETGGEIHLEYDSSSFTFQPGSDVVEAMRGLRDAFSKHIGNVVNLECLS